MFPAQNRLSLHMHIFKQTILYKYTPAAIFRQCRCFHLFHLQTKISPSLSQCRRQVEHVYVRSRLIGGRASAPATNRLDDCTQPRRRSRARAPPPSCVGPGGALINFGASTEPLYTRRCSRGPPGRIDFLRIIELSVGLTVARVPGRARMEFHN